MKKYGALDVAHTFDSIPDKDIEANIKVAQNTVQTNVDKGLLDKDFSVKLPNLVSGLALSFAAAEKGNSKAAKRAREAAYIESDKQPFIKSTENKLLQATLPKIQGTPKTTAAKASSAKLVDDTEEKTNVISFTDEPSEKTNSGNLVDRTANIRPIQESARYDLAKTEYPISFLSKNVMPLKESNGHEIHNMPDDQKEILESRKIIESKSIFDKDFWSALKTYGKKMILPDIERKANDWIFSPILKSLGNLNKNANSFIENNEYAEKIVNLIFNSEDEDSSVDPVENYKHNKTVDLYKTGAMSGKFINNQSKLKDFKFGIEDVEDNGCGLIATYNVLQGVGKPLNFADLIYENENSAIFKGGFGVYPTGISDFLKSNDLEVVTDYIGVDKNYDISNCDAVIHLYFRENMTAHYVAGISVGNGKFRFYNSATGSTLPMTWKEYFEDTIQTNEENPVIYSSAYKIKK